MSFNLLYVAATSSEADALKKITGIVPVRGGYRSGNVEINVLVTGVGSVATVWSMKQWLSENKKPDLALNAGIAGSYNCDMGNGDVVMPLTDCFADAGIEDGDRFLTLSEAGLIGGDEFPFRNGLLHNDTTYGLQMKSIIRSARAITVNTATGSEATRMKLVQKFNPDIETMEGATFFYLCIREKIPFLAVRAISNKVEPRDKSKWNISLALDNLSEKLNEIITRLE
jgi:futalosine hydrolase